MQEEPFNPAPGNRRTPVESSGGLPAYTRHLYGFAVANAVNFTVALGTPMVLTAKFLGAGESLIGLLIALTPFLVVLQIPAAGYADRLGYRRLMTVAWRWRAYFLLLIAPLPLLQGEVAGSLLLGLMILFVFAFNFIRGFASGAWLPWISRMIPAEMRGRYLGLDQTFMNSGVMAILLLSGWFLGASPPAWRYSVVMVVGWAAGLISVHFLERAPEYRVEPEGNPQRGVSETVKTFRELWRHKSFRTVTAFMALHGFSMAAFPGFLVVYLRDRVGLSAGSILVLSSATTLGSMITARLLGSVMDRFGSRPVMRLAGIGQVLMFGFWAVHSLGHGSTHVLLFAAVYLLLGVFATANALPQIRILLTSCPREKVTLALAMSQVVIAFSCGVAAVLWGILLESLAGAGLSTVSPYAVFFFVSLFLCLITQIMLGRIREAEALAASDLFVRYFWRWPMRVLSGVWIQRRGGNHRQGG
jgi:MFS family permease